MDCVIYARSSTSSQDHRYQIETLKKKAEAKGWNVKRVFAEKISGTINGNRRVEFSNMTQYLDNTTIDLVLVTEISRIGRRVVDVLNNVESLHTSDVGLFVNQLDMCSLDTKKNEDAVFKLLLQMLSIGAEMENDLRKSRQREGIDLAKRLNPNKYSGRKKGATTDRTTYLNKYSDIVDLINKSDLSIRRMADITGRSVNTVRKVKALLV